MWFLECAATSDQNVYYSLSYSTKLTSKQVGEESMSDAAARLRGTEKTSDVEVSVDGTWQSKGLAFSCQHLR